jgi:hypothetical protein
MQTDLQTNCPVRWEIRQDQMGSESVNVQMERELVVRSGAVEDEVCRS